MADRFARVTLLAPYKDADGNALPQLVLRYGFEQARQVGGQYWGGQGNEHVPMSERVWEEGSGRPPQFQRGKPIDYVMSWEDEEYRAVIVPDYVAWHYFGDYTIPVSQTSNYNEPERTYAAERRRVATLWGGFAKEQRDRNIPNHWRSLRNIAPPNVPRVSVQPLDASQRSIPGALFDPWAHFRWEADVTPIGDSKKSEPEMPQQNGIFLTPTQIQEMINSGVAEALKAQTGRKASAA